VESQSTRSRVEVRRSFAAGNLKPAARFRIRSEGIFVDNQYLDTPWRFRSPKELWRYLGIGLERRHSGNGPEQLRVPLQVNRLLKSTILGAASFGRPRRKYLLTSSLLIGGVPRTSEPTLPYPILTLDN
jgi:hypothetical protein